MNGKLPSAEMNPGNSVAFRNRQARTHAGPKSWRVRGKRADVIRREASISRNIAKKVSLPCRHYTCGPEVLRSAVTRNAVANIQIAMMLAQGPKYLVTSILIRRGIDKDCEAPWALLIGCSSALGVCKYPK